MHARTHAGLHDGCKATIYTKKTSSLTLLYTIHVYIRLRFNCMKHDDAFLLMLSKL